MWLRKGSPVYATTLAEKAGIHPPCLFLFVFFSLKNLCEALSALELLPSDAHSSWALLYVHPRVRDGSTAPPAHAGEEKMPKRRQGGSTPGCTGWAKGSVTAGAQPKELKLGFLLGLAC